MATRPSLALDWTMKTANTNSVTTGVLCLSPQRLRLAACGLLQLLPALPVAPEDRQHLLQRMLGHAAPSHSMLSIPSPAVLPLPGPLQLQLDYSDDVYFGGQLPVGAVCSFGAPLIPLVAVQPAPPAAGGGTFLYLWLRPDEARELEAALKAEQAEQAQRPD